MSNYKKNAAQLITQNPKIIDEKIKSGKIAGIYCFFGDEEYMADYYIKRIISECGASDFDCAVFDADNFDINLFRDTIAAYPVMSDHKIAIVKNAGDIKFKSGEKDELVKILTEYKEDILEYCCLVFKIKDLSEAKGKNVGRDAPGAPQTKTNANQIPGAPQTRTNINQIPGAPGASRPTKKPAGAALSLTAFLKENADLFEFKENPPASLIKWLRKIAASENTELSGENAEYILNRTENKMYPLKNELDKLIRFTQAENRSEITREDIELLVPRKIELEAFELTNAILDKKYGKAIESLEKLRSLKEEPAVILGQIARHFCDLLPINTALSSGTSDSFAVSQKTGIHEYKARLTINALKRHTDPADFIKRSLELCRDCDVKVKSTPLPDYTLIENLLFNISNISGL